MLMAVRSLSHTLHFRALTCQKLAAPSWLMRQAAGAKAGWISGFHIFMACMQTAVAPAGASDKHPRKDLNRRTSSGNWIEDRVTWKEELNYKKAMGYL